MAIVALVAGLALAGCRGQPVPAAPAVPVRPGGTVREALVGKVTSLDPRQASTPAERVVCGLLFSALAGVDGEGRVFPDLAVGWAAGRGGMYWTVRLRPDVFWHDGQPVSVDDVLFSLEAYPRPPGLSWQKVDRRSIRFFLTYPDAGFPYWLATAPILPRHLLAQDGGAAGAASAFARRPVGTGPFRLEAWVEDAGGGQEIRLLPHERYHRGRPRLDGLVLRIYPTPDRASRALLRGDVDLGPLLPAHVARCRDRGWQVLETHQPYYIALAFNCRRVPADVRRAIALALDRHALVNHLGRLAGAGGAGTMGQGGATDGGGGPPLIREVAFVLPLISWAYPAEVPWEGYDPVRARQLLGGRKEVPALGLAVPADDPLRTGAARAVVSYLEAVGLSVTPFEDDRTAFVCRFEGPLSYDLALIPQPFPANPDLTPLLHSGQIPTGAGGGNVFAYREPALDVLLDRLRQELDPATRKSLVQQVAELVCRDVPLLPLWTERLYLGLRPGLMGPGASPYGWHWNLHEWYWSLP